MATTMGELRALLDGMGLKYYLHPNKPMVLASFGGNNGSYRIGILLEFDGEFLQFRTMSYEHCAADAASLPEVLELIGGLNFRQRLIKYGWDSSDGEIAAYADMWLMDTKLTQQQLQRMLQNYIGALDRNHPELEKALEAPVKKPEKERGPVTI